MGGCQMAVSGDVIRLIGQDLFVVRDGFRIFGLCHHGDAKIIMRFQGVGFDLDGAQIAIDGPLRLA